MQLLKKTIATSIFTNFDRTPWWLPQSKELSWNYWQENEIIWFCINIKQTKLFGGKQDEGNLKTFIYKNLYVLKLIKKITIGTLNTFPKITCCLRKSS